MRTAKAAETVAWFMWGQERDEWRIAPDTRLTAFEWLMTNVVVYSYGWHYA